MRFVFSAPHKPLSVLTTSTPRLRMGRCSVKGWLKSCELLPALTSTWLSRTVNRRLANAVNCALRILDEATICMAFVICAVFLTDLMRRRMSRVLGMTIG